MTWISPDAISAPAETDFQREYREHLEFIAAVARGVCPECGCAVYVARDDKACSNILCEYAHGGL